MNSRGDSVGLHRWEQGRNSLSLKALMRPIAVCCPQETNSGVLPKVLGFIQ